MNFLNWITCGKMRVPKSICYRIHFLIFYWEKLVDFCIFFCERINWFGFGVRTLMQSTSEYTLSAFHIDRICSDWFERRREEKKNHFGLQQRKRKMRWAYRMANDGNQVIGGSIKYDIRFFMFSFFYFFLLFSRFFLFFFASIESVHTHQTNAMRCHEMRHKNNTANYSYTTTTTIIKRLIHI